VVGILGKPRGAASLASLVGVRYRGFGFGQCKKEIGWQARAAAPGRRRMRRTTVRAALCAAIALAAAYVAAAPAQAQTITLNGAVQFNDEHAFTKALVRFEELVKKYYGKPINFVLHKNSSLGLEKQYFEYMAQGKAVDYGIVSPAHMSTFSRAAPFIDAPFLFRDLDHWNKVLDADILAPIAAEIAQKADVMLIGYAGGGVRNIFINKPLGSLAEVKGLKVRVQGAAIWSRTFAATGMSPTVIAYNEIYNAIQNNVISAGENEAAGVESMKFYEVAPNLAMTEHAITIRPICFSAKTFKQLPADLQEAIVKAGKEAGAYGRQVESSEDAQKLDQLEKAGRLKRVPFKDRAEMAKLVEPVIVAYAKEIGADEILAKINAVK
jgi:tripartite ATP-independent transporter DctP family solute receptor